MFATLTQYRVNPIFKEEFVSSWEDLIAHLRSAQFARHGTLHTESRIAYMSYVIWHSRDKFERIFNNEVPEFLEEIKALHGYCNNVQLLHRLDIIKENTPLIK